jgi:hypothetical protein
MGTVFPGANIQLIDKTTELVPGITLIALVSDAPGTKELKELPLAINTADGIVLVVGCSHPGIEGRVIRPGTATPGHSRASKCWVRLPKSGRYEQSVRVIDQQLVISLRA